MKKRKIRQIERMASKIPGRKTLVKRQQTLSSQISKNLQHLKSRWAAEIQANLPSVVRSHFPPKFRPNDDADSSPFTHVVRSQVLPKISSNRRAGGHHIAKKIPSNQRVRDCARIMSSRPGWAPNDFCQNSRKIRQIDEFATNVPSKVPWNQCRRLPSW